MKHFTVLKLFDEECPMIGTIQNIPNEKLGYLCFKEDLLRALVDYFDTNLIEFPDGLPNLFDGNTYTDMTVKVDQDRIVIRIIETWFY